MGTCPAPTFQCVRVQAFYEFQKEFLAQQDADTIHKATKGLGCNDKRLVEVICGRSKAQLAAIDMVIPSSPSCVRPPHTHHSHNRSRIT